MPKEFFISLKVMIQNSEGKVLFLIKEKNGQNFLDLPGGRMEGSDSFEESIKRELSEELSLTGEIKVLNQVGAVWELPSNFVKEGKRQLIITLSVEADLSELELSDEHIDHIWIGLEDIEGLEGKNFVLLEGYRRNLEVLLG